MLTERELEIHRKWTESDYRRSTTNPDVSYLLSTIQQLREELKATSNEVQLIQNELITAKYETDEQRQENERLKDLIGDAYNYRFDDKKVQEYRKVLNGLHRNDRNT